MASDVQILRPGVVCIKTDTRKEAEIAAVTMQAMLNLVASQKRVYLRKAIEISSDQDFELGTTKWATRCRFMIIEGPPGIENPRVYDDGNLVSSFGLVGEKSGRMEAQD